MANVAVNAVALLSFVVEARRAQNRALETNSADRCYVQCLGCNDLFKPNGAAAEDFLICNNCAVAVKEMRRDEESLGLAFAYQEAPTDPQNDEGRDPDAGYQPADKVRAVAASVADTGKSKASS